MKPPLLCNCGVRYFPKQAWIHEPHMVVNTDPISESVVVNKRTLDRHKKTDARKKYQLEWMRKRRANQGVDQAGKD